MNCGDLQFNERRISYEFAFTHIFLSSELEIHLYFVYRIRKYFINNQSRYENYIKFRSNLDTNLHRSLVDTVYFQFRLLFPYEAN